MKGINRITSFFKHLFFKKNNYELDYYYQNLIEKYTDLSFYINLSNSLHVKNSLLTNKEILLLNKTAFITTNKTDIINRFGRPNFNHVLKDCPLSIEILFYRAIIGKYKVRFEIHLYKNKLFYYNYTFSCFNYHDKGEAMKTLEKKYLNETTFDYENYYIIDRNQSVIMIEESVDFKINYLSFTSDVINNISVNQSKRELKNIEEIEKGKSELYERL